MTKTRARKKKNDANSSKKGARVVHAENFREKEDIVALTSATRPPRRLILQLETSTTDLWFELFEGDTVISPSSFVLNKTMRHRTVPIEM